MVLIGITGNKGVGKDTVADYLVENYDFQKFSFADPIKEVCRELFGFNEEQLYGNDKEEKDEEWGIKPREAFQFIGTDLFRKQMKNLIPGIEENFWIKVLEKKIEKCEKSVVIADVRFENEAEMIRNQGGYIIKIKNHKQKKIDEHESEKNIDMINSDFECSNHSIKENLFKRITGLVNRFIREENDKIDIKFYGTNKNKEYFFLSNFYYSPMEIDGQEWQTVEHYFQAKKFSENPKYKEKIRTTDKPSEAKRLGSTRKYKIRDDWEECKEEIMKTALRRKFNQNEELKEKLLETRNRKLIEDSPTDYYWGIGKEGNGKNRLGILLMKVREIIKKEKEKKRGV
jgi:hypothetical protein